MRYTLEFSDFGVQLDDLEKDRTIFLDFEAWQRLVEIQNQIEQYLANGKDQQWILDEDKEIWAQVCRFKGGIYIHIRHWYNGRPSKHGVSITPTGWKVIKPHLIPKAEVTLGMKVFKDLIKEHLDKLIKKHCEGCEIDSPSQRDHGCLMDAESQAECYFPHALNEVQPIQFINKFTKEAAKQGLKIRDASDTYHHIRIHYMDKVQSEVLDS